MPVANRVSQLQALSLSQALGLEPSSSTYEARANAYIKLEKYIEAADDANKAIALDKNNAKAYLRKG